MPLGFNANVTIQKVNEEYYRTVGFLNYKNEEISVIVKGGFITDGASVPKFLWRFIGSPFTGNYTSSSIIHDSLYGSHVTTKEVADSLFLEMLEVEGVSYWKRTLMYLGVSWFGQSSWDKSDEVIKQNEKLVEVEYANSIN